MLNEIYKEYGPYFYVPMTQGFAMAVPVTLGCSWDQCLYCDLNHDNRFYFLGLETIREKLRLLKTFYSGRKRPVEKVVLCGGNPFCLSADLLLEISRLIRAEFPQVKNISAFARADDILRKTREELLLLKKSGMGELSVGVESGSDRILAFHHKGVTRDETLCALQRLEECGIPYSAYVMLGLGGKRWSRENALETAGLLNKVDPQVLTLVTLVLFPEARLIEKVKSREFIRLNALESIREERLLLENLSMRHTLFNVTHKTNALILKGMLPDQKEALLQKIDRALQGYAEEGMRAKELAKWRNWSVE